MYRIGLTGGIATGKSTVAEMLRQLGAQVIDADQVAREVMQPGQPAYADIVAYFGPAVAGPAGRSRASSRAGIQRRNSQTAVESHDTSAHYQPHRRIDR